jgi:hypothetical protein
MVDPVRENERALQPDPMLREGRSSRAWTWLVAFAILAVLVVTFLATTGGEQTAKAPGSDQAPPVTTGSAVDQQAPGLPGGRGTAAAPPTSQNTQRVR